ncbi:MAG: polyketide synthase, partial [Candidatus Riflebacteria bacterium]|nr:polyketide synthase [Candidatus Riflebacteria bacterium]
MHQPDDICVVAYGCVLPDASDPAAFWKNLLNAHCAIREIPDQRWNKSLYYAPDSTDTDFTTGASAAWISNDVLNAGGFSGANRLRQLTMQAAAQIADKLTGVEPERVNIYLGCMDIDELYSRLIFPVRESDYIRANLPVSPNGLKETMASQLQRYFAADSASPDEIRDSMLTSSVLHHLKSHLKLKGEVGLIDAACASSLAAFDVSMQMLKAREADLAISGGIESNLGAGAFILFSILGALAPDRCLPFDQRGKGLSLGEGAVLFALERLEDALKKGHQIHGVLKSCGASSDGRATSIFAPTVAGQKRAYAKAYAGLDPAKIAYLECHGTGTRTGDETELQSVREFFDRPTLPLGSVKALVGHTKGA